MTSLPLLNQYQSERDQLLTTITGYLERDPGVRAVWLTGSLGRGESDALSDIDVWIVVADDGIQEIIAHPRRYAAQIDRAILFLEAPQNAPVGGAYLMTCYDAPLAPHIVDWYWQPQADARIPKQVRLFFDRAGLEHTEQPVRFTDQVANKEPIANAEHFISYFWMMLMITAKYVYRNPWAEKMEFLSLLMDPFAKAYQFLGRETIPGIEALSPHPSPGDKLRILCSLGHQMSELMVEIADRGEKVPGSIEAGVYRYLDLIEKLTVSG